jgi:CBS domain-containing membrane protein
VLKVKHIMSREVVALEEDEDLDLAQTMMQLARIRHLPVLKNGRLVGLVSHRDLLRAQISDMAALTAVETEAVRRAIHASQVMTRDVRTVGPDTPLLEAARLIHKLKLGCLPVLEGDTLVGIITESDFVRLVIEGLEDVEQESART